METIGAMIAALALEEPADRRRPLLIGIAGGVGVGKTSATVELVRALAARGRSAASLSTDCFLHPNALLVERGLMMQKGFPDTFDHDRAATTIARLSEGEEVEVPVYSHDRYDIVADQRHRIEPADVVVVEGIYALQPAVRRHLGCAVYLDAPEGLLRSWFVDRFMGLCARAEEDESSFYRLFTGLDEAERRRQAEAVWDGVNALNLRLHIRPTMDSANIVVEKGAGHRLVGVRRQEAAL